MKWILKLVKKKKLSLWVFMFSLLSLAFCGFHMQIIDKTLRTTPFIVKASKVKAKLHTPHICLTGAYKGIDDMYADSEYVVAGTIKDIQYFENNCVLLRKINVLISHNYKGKLRNNMMISLVENDGYLRLKSYFKKAELLHAKTENLLGSFATNADAKNDILIRYYFIDREDSKIGDNLLLFLTDSSSDTYKNKTVRLDIVSNLGQYKLAYPKGAFVSLGLGMGKFTKIGEIYKRYNYYYTPQGKIDGIQIIKDSYTVKEMQDALDKAKL